MANINAPFGFKLASGIASSKPNLSVREYIHDDADSTALFIGDVVKIVPASEDSGTAIVTAAAAGDLFVGVVVGINPFKGVGINDLNLNRVYCPASTRMFISVCDDPMAIFEVQTGSGYTAAQMGYYANLIATAGSTTTGQSNFTLNTADSTTTKQFQIIGNVLSPDNAVGEAYTRVLVRPNKHAYLL